MKKLFKHIKILFQSIALIFYFIGLSIFKRREFENMFDDVENNYL